MVAVAHKRWPFVRGSNYKALTGKILVFWIGVRLREVIAHGGSTVFRITFTANGEVFAVLFVLSSLYLQNDEFLSSHILI